MLVGASCIWNSIMGHERKQLPYQTENRKEMRLSSSRNEAVSNERL